MLVVMSVDATQEQIEAVAEQARRLGYSPHVIPGATRPAIGITGNRGPDGPDSLRMMPGCGRDSRDGAVPARVA
jgi:3-deoxy-7-phosphoheptulonate synthase